MKPAGAGGGGMGGLSYDLAGGTFTLTTRSHIKISCQMDFLLYPFDTQICKFQMRPDKDSRYQVKNTLKKKMILIKLVLLILMSLFQLIHCRHIQQL